MPMKKILLFSMVVLLVPMFVKAQQAPAYALTNVMIHDPGGSSVNGHIVWRNGSITHIGTNVDIPFDARVTDGGDSLHVYPGFINGSGTWGMPQPPRRSPQQRETNPGDPTYERAGIRPDRVPANEIDTEDETPGNMFNLGFTASAVGFREGMLSGQMDVFRVSDSGLTLFKSDVAQKFQLAGAGGVYPNTLMGILVRYRQLMEDATTLQLHQQRYNANPASMEAPDRDLVLESLFEVVNKNQPVFAHADSKDDILRILKLQDEYGFNMVLVSGAHAYQLASELKSRNIPVLATLNIPEKPEMKDDSTKIVSDEEKDFFQTRLTAWEAERDNIKTLIDNGISVGVTIDGVRPADLRKKLALLVESGLTEQQINQLLSANTASILGVGSNFGSLKSGFQAAMTVFNGEMTNKDSKLIFVTDGTHLKEAKTPNSTGRGQR